MYSWVLTAMSLYGAYLNVKKHWMGFILWAIVDILWAVYDFSIEEYAQGCLFMCFFGLAAWGALTWKNLR